jgi:thermitase
MTQTTRIYRYKFLSCLILCTCTLWLVIGFGLQTSWANSAEQKVLLGLVKSRPDSLTGYGAWTVAEETTTGAGTLYTVLVDDRTRLTSAMPNVGDSVAVTGTLQGATTIVAEQLHRKSESSLSPTNKLYGWVKSAPPNGVGEWVLRLRQDTTQTVVADSNTRFLEGIPREGKAVEVRYVLQNGTTYLAKNIRPDDYEAQQIIARLRTGVLSTTIAARYGLIAVATIFPTGNIHLYRTPEAQEGALVQQLNRDPDVIWAELNYIGHVPVGNPKRVWNWGGTDPTGYTNQQAFDQVHVAAAHAHYRGEDTVIAVIDTGADLNHEALRDHLAPPSEFWDAVDSDALPQDDGPGYAQGHGTHIAGIIVRMAPASKLLIVRALDPNGRGNTAKVAYAIDWAVEHGADVINLSLGANFDSRVLELAVTSALEKGVVVVAAAGNDNTSDRQYPAGYAGVLSVTAVDGAKVKADFANYSKSWVKVAAPGVGITSSIIGPQGSGYASWSGTSMATAFVSGAAALLRQQDPDADQTTINSRLRNHTQELDSTNPNYVGQLGGLLDVRAALNLPPVGAATPAPLSTPTPISPALETPTPNAPAATATPVPDVPAAAPPLPTAVSTQGQNYLYLSVVKVER